MKESGAVSSEGREGLNRGLEKGREEKCQR